MRLAKALGRAATAVPACVRILRRRRPDVVLGGGGYVAGPMVLAAGSMRIPAALSEADAHLGLANRLAAPFAKVVFLAYPVEGLEPPKYQVVGRPIPARSQPGDRGRSTPPLRASGEGARRPRLRREPGRAAAQRGCARGIRQLGPGRAAPGRRARLSRSRGHGSRAASTGCFRSPTISAPRSPRPTSSLPAPAAPSGRSPRPAGRRCSSRTRTRPPTTRPRTPATSSAAEAPSSCRSPSSTCAGRSRSFSPTRASADGWVRR